MFSGSTVSPRILCLTVDLSSHPRYGELSAKLWVQLPVCPPVTIPRLKARWSRLTRISSRLYGVSPNAIQPPGVFICPGSRSLVSSATGISPFMASTRYQPPLFPAQEEAVTVPSVQENLRQCRRVWRAAEAALISTALQNQRLADRHRPPNYQPGQKVWLSSWHLLLQVESSKLAPRYIGPFEMRK